MSSANPTDLLLRPATADDAAAVARVHLLARAGAVADGTMPPGVRADDQVRSWLAERVELDEVWVAQVEGDPVAYLRLTEEWLDDLYVLPTHAGRGIGSALLELAQALRPDGFGLWVFVTNRPARDFYAARGLREVERTDGRDNEERAPDLRMLWEP